MGEAAPDQVHRDQTKPQKRLSQGTIFLILISLIGAIAGVLMGLFNPLFPPAASDEGVQVDHLFSTILGICTFIFVIVVGPLVYTVFRYNSRRQASRPPDFSENRSLHLTWTIVPIFIVIFMGTYAFIVLLDIAKPRTSELTVEVTAQQWSWSFYYPDAQVTSFELHLPVNKTVLLKMHSLDVIHNLWIPMFRIKEDVLPDRVTTELHTPNRLGTFALICNKLCGVGHAGMTTTVVVQTLDDFNAWLASRKASQTTTPTAAPTAASTTVPTPIPIATTAP